MKKFYTLLTLFFFISCSSFNVKDEIHLDKSLKKLKSSGIILRISPSDFVSLKSLESNLSKWISGVNKKINLKIISNSDKKLKYFSDNSQRFYQLSSSKSFLKYKSIGIIKEYIKDNEESLKMIISENNLDSLIFYEIESVYSMDLQFIDFNSVIVIIDKNFNVLLEDYQSQNFEVHEYDEEVVKNNLLDKVSERFIQKIEKLKFISKDNKKK